MVLPSLNQLTNCSKSFDEVQKAKRLTAKHCTSSILDHQMLERNIFIGVNIFQTSGHVGRIGSIGGLAFYC